MNNNVAKLFSKQGFLDEKPSDFDALEYKHERDQLKTCIDRLVAMRKHSIVAYLGPYGIGKSTILREVKKISPHYIWVEFDMWRYSSRNELWDAFVIKMAAELTKGKDELDIADEVEGSSFNRRDGLILLIWSVGIWLGLTFLSFCVWLVFRDGTGVADQFWVAYLKYAMPTIAPVILFVGLGRILQLSFITEKRPLKRVFEL